MEEGRRTGPVPVDPALAEVIGRLRRTEGIDAPPELDLDAVRAVETGLGTRMPNDVLALLAAGSRFLRDAWGIDVTTVVGLTGKARASGIPGDFIAFGRHGPSGRWVGFRKGAQPPEGTLVVLHGGGEVERQPLDQWIAARAEEAGEARDTPAPPAEAEPVVPVLVRRLPESAHGRRVRHSTFGEGYVLRETGRGPDRKVQVDFPGRGLKLLKARFLEWLE